MNAIGGMLWPLVLLPMLGAIVSYLAGIKRRALSGWIASSAAGLSFFWVLYLVLELPHGQAFEQRLFDWISVGDLQAQLTLRFDALSAVMCLVVTGVGSLIHFYSIAYMAADESQGRFFAYMNLFLFAMLLLVLAGNLAVLFIGWEGVGFCSYLLIGFWFKNEQFARAGRKAWVANRIGDAGFLAGIFILYVNFGTLDFAELALLITRHPDLTALYSAIALCLFLGATGKSAQIPLLVWLPDAMAGPTPVSALIHAATMVTAGVYLMARLNFLFSLAPAAMAVVAVVALLTAFVAATCALAQNDIKKVLAYSTISQLGFMFMAAAAGAYWISIFHIVTHSFFKAALFLAAGAIMHSCHHEQDLQRLGGLARKMPLTCVSFCLAGLALAGIAPLAGYYSKHAILEALSSGGELIADGLANWCAAGATVVAFVTALYITRAFALTFLGAYKGSGAPREAPWKMGAVLAVLALLSVAGGYFLAWPEMLQHYLKPVLGNDFEYELGSFWAQCSGSAIGILGVAVGLLVYAAQPGLADKFEEMFPILSRLFKRKYYLDELYQLLVIRPLESGAGLLWRYFDQFLIDGAVNTTGRALDATGEMTRYSQTGQIRHYVLFIFLATVVLVAFYMVF